MAAIEGSLRPPPEGLLPAVERHFGLRLELGRRLTGGYANHVFRVESPRGPLALRATNPPVDVDDLAWEHDVVRQLAKRVPEAAAPLGARDGSTFVLHEGWAGSLLPFVEGRPADREDSRSREAVARHLARLHRAAARLEVPQRPRVPALRQLDWPPVRDYPADFQIDEVARARVWAAAWVSSVDRDLPAGLVHGDFFRGNVLTDGARVTGFVDWEEAHVDWFSYELANGVWEFCKRATYDGFHADRGRAFVAAYRAAGGPAREADDDLLVGLIRAKRVLEVLRAPTDRRVDWEYQRANLRAFRALESGLAGW